MNLDIQMSLKPVANRVASALLAYQDADGVSEMNMPTMMVIAGMSRQSVWRGMTELKKRGLVVEFLPGKYRVNEALGKKVQL